MLSNTLSNVNPIDYDLSHWAAHEKMADEKNASIARLRSHQAKEEEKEVRKYRPTVKRFVVFPEQEHRNTYRDYLNRLIGS